MHHKCALIEIGTWTTQSKQSARGQKHCRFIAAGERIKYIHVAHKPHFAGEVYIVLSTDSLVLVGGLSRQELHTPLI